MSQAKANKDEEHKFGIFFDDDYDYLQHLKDAAKDSVQWIPVETGNNANIKVLRKKEKALEEDDTSDDEVFRVEVSFVEVFMHPVLNF